MELRPRAFGSKDGIDCANSSTAASLSPNSSTRSARRFSWTKKVSNVCIGHSPRGPGMPWRPGLPRGPRSPEGPTGPRLPRARFADLAGRLRVRRFIGRIFRCDYVPCQAKTMATYLSDYAELLKRSVNRIERSRRHRLDQCKRERFAGKWRGYKTTSRAKSITLRGIFSEAVATWNRSGWQCDAQRHTEARARCGCGGGRR